MASPSTHNLTLAQDSVFKRRLHYAVMALLILAIPEAAMANPWDSMLNTIIGVLNGGTARLLAILVIIGAGFAAWRGKLDFTYVGGVLGGIVLIFGAAAIADFFTTTV